MPPFMTTAEGLEMQIGVNHFGTSRGVRERAKVMVMASVVVRVNVAMSAVVRCVREGKGYGDGRNENEGTEWERRRLC